MSVGFRWALIENDSALQHGGSTDYEILREVFGDPPWEFRGHQAEMLRAMAASRRLQEWETKNIFSEIAELLDKHGSVRVWGEW